MVLYKVRLDEVIGANHLARLFDGILECLDGTAWQSHYHGRLGQPPLHPRVLAGVLLYGLLTRVRSSLALEEALRVRLDFRWLAQGFTIDHSTLSEFRRKHALPLKDLFRQVGLLARQLELVSLQRVCFDGTRTRANSRRGSTRTTKTCNWCRRCTRYRRISGFPRRLRKCSWTA
jgi:transposase